ncbi:hypothetical protein MLD38_035225 [Melastoma candidum]|uniref:Uncharacterized protein n=1 Tax=Melastoma candidum TaxID=119954 RepID=A0ACB9MC57_9MYRT|nr:hypothetical protein MLD38_035225 [Melastoma candidum]
MSATTVPPPTSSSEGAQPDPSMLELDLRLRHPQQPPVPPAGYTAVAGASSTATKSRPRRPAKPPPPKKQPQRGLGVAQLERLRLQERWKKLVEIPGPQLQQLPGPMTSPMPADPQAVPHFQYLQAGVAGGGTPRPPPPPPPPLPSPFQYHHVMESAGSVPPHRETGGRCLPPGVFGMGRGYLVGNPLLDGWDCVNSGASRELSSMPNARALVPDHADHNIYLTAGMNGKVKPVVGGVVLEYEFFPGKRCRNTWNEEQCMPSVGVEGRGAASDSAPASSSAAAESSNSIDLSLKL